MDPRAPASDSRRAPLGLLLACLILLCLGVAGAAFLPLAECPRCAALSRDPFARDGGPLRIEDFEHCRYCSDRGKVPLFKKWTWNGRYSSP